MLAASHCEAKSLGTTSISASCRDIVAKLLLWSQLVKHFLFEHAFEHKQAAFLVQPVFSVAAWDLIINLDTAVIFISFIIAVIFPFAHIIVFIADSLLLLWVLALRALIWVIVSVWDCCMMSIACIVELAGQIFHRLVFSLLLMLGLLLLIFSLRITIFATFSVIWLVVFAFDPTVPVQALAHAWCVDNLQSWFMNRLYQRQLGDHMLLTKCRCVILWCISNN